MDVRCAWEAIPESPQRQAYESLADDLFYGGAAGGGKSDLLLGLANTAHFRSIIFRREFAQLEGLEERAQELYGHNEAARFNGTKHRWRWFDSGKLVEFGSSQEVNDVMKYQGRPHDLVGFDEIPHFTKFQYEFLKGWARTTRPGQRVRTVAAGNPPTDADGDWVIEYWGAWLDKTHPKFPYPYGELLWYAKIDGVDVEQPNGEPFWHEDELIQPKSRTFIPASVEDNPYLMATGYKAQLQNLPEPLRSKMLFGDFGVSQVDDAWQVIPSEWIDQAMARWKPKPVAERGHLDAVGCDVARGGKDKTVYTPRYGNWFDEQKSVPGKATPDGQAVVRDYVNIVGPIKGTRFQVDVIGIGSSPADIGRMFDIDVRPLNGSNGSTATDKSGKLRFSNKRAERIWKLREALDPDNGDDLQIPPDRELAADLKSFRWELKANGIKIESKDEIKERIKRSPDKGESLVYAHANDDITIPIVIPIVGSRPRNLPGQNPAPMYSWSGVS